MHRPCQTEAWRYIKAKADPSAFGPRDDTILLAFSGADSHTPPSAIAITTRAHNVAPDFSPASLFLVATPPPFMCKCSLRRSCLCRIRAVRELKLKLRCVTAPMLFCKSMSHWELLVICVQENEPARLSWRDFFKAGCGIRTTRLSGARAIYSNERILSGPTILRGYFFDGSI